MKWGKPSAPSSSRHYPKPTAASQSGTRLPVLIISLYASIVYGYLYVIFTTLTEVFQYEYGISTGAVGLSYLGLGTYPKLNRQMLICKRLIPRTRRRIYCRIFHICRHLGRLYQAQRARKCAAGRSSPTTPGGIFGYATRTVPLRLDG